mgnify:CR=1 FL=1
MCIRDSIASNALEEAIIATGKPVSAPPAPRNWSLFFWILNRYNVFLANDVAEEVTHRMFQSNSDARDVEGFLESFATIYFLDFELHIRLRRRKGIRLGPQ